MLVLWDTFKVSWEATLSFPTIHEPLKSNSKSHLLVYRVVMRNENNLFRLQLSLSSFSPIVSDSNLNEFRLCCGVPL